MSCFIMNERTLASMARRLTGLMNVNDNVWRGFSGNFKELFWNSLNRKLPSEEVVYNMLYLNNLRAYCTRYDEVYEEDFIPRFNPHDMSDIQFVKSLQCWLYQSMDDENVLHSEFYKLLEGIANTCMKHLFMHTKEYEEAVWG